MKDNPRFAVIGAGPVGGIMASHLRKSWHEVILVDKLRNHIDEIRNNGLSIFGHQDVNVKFPKESLCYSVEELRGKEVDVVFIAVKVSFLESVVSELEKVVKPGTTVVSLQNGMDTEEIIADTFGKENTIRIVVNYAGNLLGNSIIRMSFFNPPNYIGTIDPSADEKAKTLARLISDAKLETAFTDDIKKYEWEKVILNSALSPVCALTRRTMKQIMEHVPARELVIGILNEGIETAKANGIEFEQGFLEHCIAYLDKAGHHRTSMHVDIERGTPTELGFLNGKIEEYSKASGIHTPYNSSIVALIKGLELPEYKEG